MKKISIFISIFSLLFISILAVVCAWYGYFGSVQVSEKPVGPFLMVYEKHVGTPSETSGIIADIKHSLSSDFKIKSLMDFGIYYDDPKVVDPQKCRAVIGCIILNDSEGDLHAISEKYIVATLPRGMAVVADYPYRNTLSILFGMLKGYPAVLDYAEMKGIDKKPVLELYDVQRGRIRYVLSTAFATEFFDSYLVLE